MVYFTDQERDIILKIGVIFIAGAFILRLVAAGFAALF